MFYFTFLDLICPSMLDAFVKVEPAHAEEIIQSAGRPQINYVLKKTSAFFSCISTHPTFNAMVEIGNKSIDTRLPQVNLGACTHGRLANEINKSTSRLLPARGSSAPIGS